MKIVVLEPLGMKDEMLRNIIEEKIGREHELVLYPDRKEDTLTLLQRSKDADIVVLSNLPYKAEVIQALPKLKMIAVAFTGVDHIAMDICKQRDIIVCNCAGYATVGVADLVFGMVIGLARNMVACDIQAREGGTKEGLVGFELAGKKFGIIGTGAIGTRVAQIANAFGCEVYAFSRTPKFIEGVEFIPMDTLLSTCDIISLHVPLNEMSKHMIGEQELLLMKQDAILINTARGGVVDNEALASALIEGRLGGAGIDVLEHEPPFAKNHPILHAPRTFITPHIAFATHQSMVKRSKLVASNIASYLDNKPQNIM